MTLNHKVTGSKPVLGTSLIEHTWCCNCGTETNVEPEVFLPGSIFQCPSCKETFGYIKPLGGGRAWIHIDKEEVIFYNLLTRYDQDGNIIFSSL